MTKPNCKEGDIVAVNPGLIYGHYSFKRYKALVLWNGYNGQPLLTRLDRWIPHWGDYGAVEEVIGHMDLGKFCEAEEVIMRDAV